MSNYGRPPPNTEGMTSLKVDNIPYRTSMETLKNTFEKYGEVGDVYIPRDMYSRESRGFAFVRFYNKDEAEDAIDALDGKVLDGRELRVQMAKYGRPSSDSRRRGPRRYSGGGGGGSRGGRYGRSRSRSPDYRRRGRSNSRSRSRSPRPKNNKRYSRSASRSKSRSPVRRTSKSRSPVRRMSKSRSRSRSRSRS